MGKNDTVVAGKVISFLALFHSSSDQTPDDVTSSDLSPEVVTSSTAHLEVVTSPDPESDPEVDPPLTRYIFWHFRVSQPVLGVGAAPSPSRREPRCAGGKGEALESFWSPADLPKRPYRLHPPRPCRPPAPSCKNYKKVNKLFLFQ